MDPSSPFYRARRAIFLSSLAAPFTPWVCHPWEEGPMGWQFKAHGMTVRRPVGWQFKAHGMTVQRPVDWRFQCRCRQLCKCLTGCPEAIMAHDTCHSSIGFYLGSKRRFVFRALPLYIPGSTFLISSFSAETYCQSTTVILVKDHPIHFATPVVNTLPPFNCYIHPRLTSSVHS